jgi:hypothetical protein
LIKKPVEIPHIPLIKIKKVDPNEASTPALSSRRIKLVKSGKPPMIEKDKKLVHEEQKSSIPNLKLLSARGTPDMQTKPPPFRDPHLMCITSARVLTYQQVQS